MFVHYGISVALSADIAKSGASTIVGALLYYCNLLLCEVSVANLHNLQGVLNTLARLVTGIKHRDHITPVLQALHWLPLTFRITYKIAILTYKASLTRQPECLSEYIQTLVRTRNLRSSGTDTIYS